jgi:hypothetical protein
MKPPTLKQIGDALGMSPPAVHKFKNKGMPTGSIEEAAAWYKRNVGHRRKEKSKLSTALPAPPTGLSTESNEPPNGAASDAPASPGASPGTPGESQADAAAKRAEAVAAAEIIPTDSESCREALREARELRKFARQMVARCNQNGDMEMARRWTQTHQQLLARQGVLENQFRNLLDRDGETIPFSAAEARFRTVLQDLKMLTTAMPAALAAKVNPQDPLHAQKLLEEWRDKTLFKSLYANN